MARRVARLDLDTLADLPPSVRRCLAWELDPVQRARVRDDEAAESEKEAWLSRVLLEWGSCGRVLYVDDEPAGYVLYAPPVYFPGSGSLPTAPVSEDAVQLATAEVFGEHRGGGLGRVLLQLMVKDLLQRGDHRAVEVFGCHPGVASPPVDCALPVPFLLRCGFGTQRAHPRTPRLRMELKSVLTWRAEVESALERLLGVVRAGRPAPVARRSEEPTGLSRPAGEPGAQPT